MILASRSFGLTDATGNTYGFPRVVVYGPDGKVKFPSGGGPPGVIPTLQQVVNAGNGITNFGGGGVASIQSTNFTNNRTLILNDNAYPTIRLVDNLNAANYLQIDIDTLNIDGVSYNWSSIVNPPTGALVALPFTIDHITATGNPYAIGDVVYYLGNVYRCIANNDSILPTNVSYWTLLGAGSPLVQQPADWNATSGNNQILNKPIIPTTPLTTKGDLYTFDTADTRLPVGLDTQVLIADSTTATGLKWGTNTLPPALGYYGAFSDVTDQFATVINTGYPMLLGVTDLTNGVTVVSGSRVTIANTGIYNIQWSGQFRNPLAAEHDVTVWLRKNGVDVPGSAGVVLVPKKHGSSDGHTLPAWNYLLDAVGGDYYEFVWSTQDLAVFISFEPAGSPPPSTASVIVTVTQQSGILAGTGITAINSLTGAVQTLTTGTTGTDFAIVDSGVDHKFNLPVASATNTGKLSSGDWTAFNNKVPSTRTLTIDGTSYDLSADRSWTTAGGSYAAYSMKANNTGAAAVPSNFTFKDLGEQAYVATIVWNGTAPTGPINLRYRWFQMGNMVQYFFYFTYTTQGVTNSTITFDFPSGMPAPTPITGTGAAGSFIYRNQALVYTAVTSPATGTATPFWGGGIRRDTANTKYEFFFTNGTAQTARAFYTSGFYFA